MHVLFFFLLFVCFSAQNYISFIKKDLPTSTALERDVKAHRSLQDHCSISSIKPDEISISRVSPPESQQSAEMLVEHFPAPVLALEDFCDEVVQAWADKNTGGHTVQRLTLTTDSQQE